MNRLVNFSVRLTQKYLPDAYVLAVFLTVIIFVSGILFAGQTPVEMSSHWAKGFSSLFNFGMQMALVLVTGYTLAQAPIVKVGLNKITKLPRSPRQAVVLVAIVSFFACYINWAFGMVVGAILAREMGKSVKGLHFPLIVAAAYSGEIIRGPSSSIPLVIAGENHFMVDQIGVIPATQTLFSSWNLVLSGLIFVALIVLYASIKVRPEDAIGFKDESTEEVDEEPKQDASLAERLDHSRWVNWLMAIPPIIYIVNLIVTGKFSLNLNIVIITFFTLAILLHRSPVSFLQTVKEAVAAARGIILQFPLYAGVAGMMSSSGLVDVVAQLFIAIANEQTFPVMTFISAGIVNFFIPSGGGQWAIQGPIMMQAAYAVGADIPQTIMAFAWGDAWTNQIQPFWALPLLGVAGLTARDIMGYCIVWLMLSGVIIASVFTLLTLF